MKEESINLAKQLIASIEKNLETMKNSFKEGDNEKFTKMKEEALNTTKKIERIII